MTERSASILAKAKEILARQPTAAEIAADETRRARNAATSSMPDLATLQTRWIVGPELSDAEFYEMRRLETLAKIAPPEPQKPATIARKAPNARKSTILLSERARLQELELKLKNGGQWSDQERAEWWFLHAMQIGDKADRLVSRNRVSDAIFLVLKEIAINAVGQARARDKLQGRIAALEPKPRVRVQAGRQVIA